VTLRTHSAGSVRKIDFFATAYHLRCYLAYYITRRRGPTSRVSGKEEIPDTDIQ
jgi:hypothetical protein